MQIVRTRPQELTLTGNIKTTDDYLEIRKLVTELVEEGGRSFTLQIVDSLSMPSSVIGFFVKLIKKEKIDVTMVIRDPRLLELLEELNLSELFGARPAS